jgi:hypothetical protein
VNATDPQVARGFVEETEAASRKLGVGVRPVEIRALSQALRAVPRVNAMYVAVALIVIGLAGSMITWGQGLKGPMGDQGPPGPKGPAGDAGPPSAASSIRIVRSNCDDTSCRVQCAESEMLLTAYCGPKRNTAMIPTERAATCGATVPANSPVVAVCAQIEP